jgi:DNA-binding GntR family transcriptional regulator
MDSKRVKGSARSGAPADQAAASARRRSRSPSAARATASRADAAHQPLYQRIAAELRQAISAGTYPVGTRLPTEHELCAQFGISRFTARAAIRLLSTAGLVTRKQRIGTIVIALPGDARYRQDTSSVADLLQYAHDTELRLVYVGKLALTKTMAREFSARPGDEWVYAMGVRHDSRGSERGKKPDRPISITRIFLNPQLKGIESKLRGRKTAVYAMIEREYKVSIHRVEQELHSVLLDADDASNLQTEVGAPALRIVRRYYSDDGVLLEVADNLHPGDRFVYRMELRK